MYGCESWTIKKSEHQTIDAFELWCWRRLESPLDCKDIKPVNPKGHQSWIFIGKTDAEAVAPILWPFDGKSPSLEKTLMLGKFEGRRRRGWQEIMVGWHHWLNGHEFEQTPGVWSEGQGSLMCCSTWGGQRDTTERLNNNNNNNNNKLSKLLRENGHRAHCWEY